MVSTQQGLQDGARTLGGLEDRDCEMGGGAENRDIDVVLWLKYPILTRSPHWAWKTVGELEGGDDDLGRLKDGARAMGRLDDRDNELKGLEDGVRTVGELEGSARVVERLGEGVHPTANGY